MRLRSVSSGKPKLKWYRTIRGESRTPWFSTTSCTEKDRLSSDVEMVRSRSMLAPCTDASRTLPETVSKQSFSSQRSDQCTASAGVFEIEPCRPRLSPLSSEGAPAVVSPQVLSRPPGKDLSHSRSRVE